MTQLLKEAAAAQQVDQTIQAILQDPDVMTGFVTKCAELGISDPEHVSHLFEKASARAKAGGKTVAARVAKTYSSYDKPGLPKPKRHVGRN